MTVKNPETVFEAWFSNRVRLVGGYSLKLAPIEAGVPDRLVVMPAGRMYLVELKQPQGALRAAQSAWHEKLWRGQGVHVHVVRDKESALKFLRLAAGVSEVELRKERSRRRNGASAQPDPLPGSASLS